MVLGIDSFRGKFKDYTDYYTIIGGTACDILLTSRMNYPHPVQIFCAALP